MNKLENIKKIIVFRPDQIGDVILTTPVYKNLKAAYPNAKLVTITGPWAREVLENNPYIDKKFFFPCAFYDRGNKYNFFKKIKNILSLIILIRNEKADLFVDLKGHLKTLLFCYLSGIRFKIGKKNGWRGLLLSHSIQYTENIYEKENNLNVISLVSKVTSKELMLFPNEKETVQMQKKIMPMSGRKVFSIFPYAPSPLKRLSPSYFKEIISFLNSKGFYCLILGGKDSVSFIENLSFSKKDNLSFAGQLNLRETFIVLKHSDYCLSLDTAGAHIAKAAGVKTLVIFTYSNPVQWAEKDDLYIQKKSKLFSLQGPS